jgi:tRNA pseudouridine32 synthase/23S rRNA pseudouridine746 synthase
MTPSTHSIVVMHADDACIVVDKPAGLLSVPGRGADKADCVAARVQAQFADALVVHRLDMATSGLMLFARGAPAQRTLSRAFAQRETHKRYVAIVRGRLDGDAGEIDLPLAADWPNRPLQKIDHEHGRASLTRWRVLAREASRTRLELEPVTGRAHQLRVHLRAIGHPIVGDALYAPDERDAPRLMLHATSLRFAHPVGANVVEIDSPAPF